MAYYQTEPAPDGIYVYTRRDTQLWEEIRANISPDFRRWDFKEGRWWFHSSRQAYAISLLDSWFGFQAREKEKERKRWSKEKQQRYRVPPRQDLPVAPWRTLWLVEGAPPEVVKAAYRALAQKYHPDTGGDEEKMKQINLAYEAIR